MDADAGVQDARKGNTRKDKECLISYEAYSVFYYYHFLYPKTLIGSQHMHIHLT